MLNPTVNVNGQLLDSRSSPLVSVFDRSYLYGDSLYEVARTYGGRFYLLEEHLERLVNSGKLCGIEISPLLPRLRAEIERSLKAFAPQKSEAYLRIIISRGVGKIGFGREAIQDGPLFTLILQPVEPPSPATIAGGMSLRIVPRLRNDRRALDPAMKSGNYLNSLLAYLEAKDEGYEDALLCDFEGFLTEGTTFNIFYVKNNILATPPLDSGILEGITRRKVIDLARAAGLEVREVRFPPARLLEADEVFLTSSVREVLGVTRIDGQKIGTGRVGPKTQKLASAYRAAAEAHR